MFNSTQAAPAFQAKTARIKPKMAEGLTLMIQAYPDAPVVGVCKSFYDSIRDQIQAQIPNLKRGKKYTAKELCSPAFWEKIDKSNHTIAGKCIAIMVAQEVLLLSPAGKNDSNARCYERL